jgi:hypothetical protein
MPYVVDERDKDLPEKLEVELPGILSWVIEGYRLWQKDGLRPPAEVIVKPFLGLIGHCFRQESIDW